jgi:hypothetical protein
MVQAKVFYGQGEDGLKSFEKSLNTFMSDLEVHGFEYKGLSMTCQYIPIRGPVAVSPDTVTVMPLFIATLTYEVGNHMAGEEIGSNNAEVIELKPGEEV